MKEDNNTQNLISRLTEKLQMLAAGALIGATLLTGCTPTTPPANLDSSYGDNENENNNENNNQNNNENENSKYSQILQNILTDPYYVGLVQQANNNPELFNTPVYHSHPYAFLEDQGHNVEEITKGNLACFTNSFVLPNEPNNLYIATRVESKGSVEPYFTEYVIRYSLTEKEMEEYKDLHSGFFMQATFLNQEIAELKTPTIVSETKTTVSCYNKLLAFLKKSSDAKSYLGDSSVGVMRITNIDPTNETITITIQTLLPGANNMTKTSRYNSIVIQNGTMFITNTNADGAIYKPANYPAFMFSKENTSDYITVRSFHTRGLQKEDIKDFRTEID